MSNSQHIGILYSLGPHLRQVLERVRQDYPEARISVLIPKDYQALDDLEPFGAEFSRLEHTTYEKRSIRYTFALIHRIRVADYSHFIVLFPSMKLRLVAALSGAQHRMCHGPGGSVTPLNEGIVRVLAAWLANRVRGWGLYAWLRLYLLCTPLHRRGIDPRNFRAHTRDSTLDPGL